MKNYVIAAVLVLGGIGLVWFIMNDNSTPNESGIDASENEELGSQGSSSVPTVTADPVATVNGEGISNADFNTQQTQALATQGVDPATLDSEAWITIQNQILDSLISQELLEQAALASDVDVPAEEIDTQVDAIKAQFEDETMYEQALASEGLTETELRAQLAIDLSIEPYLEQTLDLASITVNEEEVNQVYQEAAAQQDLPPLEQVRNEVEQLAVQRKRQPIIDQHIAALREVATVEIFI
jgi:hypothetical protein